MRNSAKFSLNLTEVDIENERKWIITKYSGNSTSTSLDSELHGIAALTVSNYYFAVSAVFLI